jgi:hypothetical protein
VAPPWTRHPDSEPVCFCSYSLVMRDYWKSNWYQFHSLWFDTIGARPHHPPDSRRSR